MKARFILRSLCVLVVLVFVALLGHGLYVVNTRVKDHKPLLPDGYPADIWNDDDGAPEPVKPIGFTSQTREREFAFAKAKMWLGRLRDGTADYHAIDQLFREDLEMSGHDITELTNEEELTALDLQNGVLAARQWYHYFLAGGPCQRSFLQHLNEEIELHSIPDEVVTEGSGALKYTPSDEPMPVRHVL